MTIIITRNHYGKCTMGTLAVRIGSSVVHNVCTTLEPVTKIGNPKHTSIPEGTYEVAMSMSRKFGKEMPFLRNVPNRHAIMIHPGNVPSDTQGCILVGNYMSDGYICDSRKCFSVVFNMIKRSIDSGEKVYVEIKAKG